MAKRRLKSPKQKGNKFEREVAKKLGKLFYNNEQALIRTPTSGAQGNCGDITINEKVYANLFENTRPVLEKLPGGRFPFIIENKHHKDIKLASFIFERKGPLEKIWQTVRKEAEKNKKYPILIVKSNRSIPYLIIEFKTYSYLKLPSIMNAYAVTSEDMIYVYNFDTICEQTKPGVLLT